MFRSRKKSQFRVVFNHWFNGTQNFLHKIAKLWVIKTGFLRESILFADQCPFKKDKNTFIKMYSLIEFSLN